MNIIKIEKIINQFLHFDTFDFNTPLKIAKFNLLIHFIWNHFTNLKLKTNHLWVVESKISFI